MLTKGIISCHRCHAHKVKCSGERPCEKCRLAGCAEECNYVSRDRQVKVNESYLDQVMMENKWLKEQLHDIKNSSSETSPQGPEVSASDPDSNVRNPLLGDRAWFYSYDPSVPPIYIGEAACTAFATRLRQFLSRNPDVPHCPRTQYIKEPNLHALSGAETDWPSLAQARLLVKVAFNQAGRVYHLFLRDSTLDQLEEMYRGRNFQDSVVRCKFLAIFALGEVYSGRSTTHSDCAVPGAAYYVRAMMMIPILPERPNLTHIECLLLLSLYSYFLNRRHSGFLLIGNALRMALIIGLNHNIPERQCMNPVERQHRVRIWWAIYVFDRMWGSKTGFPLAVADNDIYVDMPSEVAADSQFSDPEYFVASIELSKITGQVIDKVYSRKEHPASFLHREQQLLIALKNWVQCLPSSIRLSRDQSTPKHVLSLHLQFNQCMILATRPILLYVLMCLRGNRGVAATRKSPEKVSQPLLILSEACIHAARHSNLLITDEWIEGSMPIFCYFYAQYLFSVALVLLISTLLPPGNTNDYTSFETAFEILGSMSKHGNLAATEFHDNLRSVKHCLTEEFAPRTAENYINTDILSICGISEGHEEEQGVNGSAGLLPSLDTVEDPALLYSTTADNLTAEMALSGPMMQNFLMQSDIDANLLGLSGNVIEDANGLFTVTPSSLWTA
ncbi:fungal-specific transcription factor [Talaromyces proteolyticus]|uniref:Fungal-specific transcription factor n=1 Tax=Talaromyces proteolyticus TaxID=1131652 RepID=A0AAD4PZP3_9EURO|nr:fungal-specific transcription factor [Talaromyces proteolyticus]KAH8703218.1 fungal-specific transcription factor [Talaromyces proteolyticus]